MITPAAFLFSSCNGRGESHPPIIEGYPDEQIWRAQVASIADEVEALDVTLEDDEVSIVRTHEHTTWWKKTSLGGQGLELREAAESIRR